VGKEKNKRGEGNVGLNLERRLRTCGAERGGTRGTLSGKKGGRGPFMLSKKGEGEGGPKGGPFERGRGAVISSVIVRSSSLRGGNGEKG